MPPNFRLGIRLVLLKILSNPLKFPYGAITLFGISFQITSGHLDRTKRESYNTTSLLALLQAIQFALYRFFSLILTASRLISFPAGTKTLQFPAFAFLSECSEEQEVSLKNLWFEGCLHLARAYRSLPRSSSLF